MNNDDRPSLQRGIKLSCARLIDRSQLNWALDAAHRPRRFTNGARIRSDSAACPATFNRGRSRPLGDSDVRAVWDFLNQVYAASRPAPSSSMDKTSSFTTEMHTERQRRIRLDERSFDQIELSSILRRHRVKSRLQLIGATTQISPPLTMRAGLVSIAGRRSRSGGRCMVMERQSGTRRTDIFYLLKDDAARR